MCLHVQAGGDARAPRRDMWSPRRAMIRGVRRRTTGKRKTQSGKRTAHNRGVLERDRGFEQKGNAQCEYGDVFFALRFALQRFALRIRMRMPVVVTDWLPFSPTVKMGRAKQQNCRSAAGEKTIYPLTERSLRVPFQLSCTIPLHSIKPHLSAYTIGFYYMMDG